MALTIPARALAPWTHIWQVGLLATCDAVFGLRPTGPDTLLVIATPGWITGQSYMIASALLTQTPSVMLEGSVRPCARVPQLTCPSPQYQSCMPGR